MFVGVSKIAPICHEKLWRSEKSNVSSTDNLCTKQEITQKTMDLLQVAKTTNMDSRAHVIVDFVETISHVIPLTEVVNMAARKDIKGSIVTKVSGY